MHNIPSNLHTSCYCVTKSIWNCLECNINTPLSSVFHSVISDIHNNLYSCCLALGPQQSDNIVSVCMMSSIVCACVMYNDIFEAFGFTLLMSSRLKTKVIFASSHYDYRSKKFVLWRMREFSAVIVGDFGSAMSSRERTRTKFNNHFIKCLAIFVTIPWMYINEFICFTYRFRRCKLIVLQATSCFSFWRRNNVISPWQRDVHGNVVEKIPRQWKDVPI